MEGITTAEAGATPPAAPPQATATPAEATTSTLGNEAFVLILPCSAVAADLTLRWQPFTFARRRTQEEAQEAQEGQKRQEGWQDKDKKKEKKKKHKSKKKDKKDKKDKKGKDKEEEDNPMQYSKFMKGAYDSSGSSSSDEVRPA
eukprot:1334226-Rhodomonas_salina.1